MTALAGYDILDVDTVAKELLGVIEECGTLRGLALLALCRAIVMLSTEDELDTACRTIDELSSIPCDKVEL